MEKFDTLIIGGGAAGLMAAIRAASLGQNVAIAEKNHSVGEKLLISGKGRCNFTNAESDINAFIAKYGDNGKFLYSAFSKFGPAETVNFFKKIGVESVEERGKRIFPASGGSQRVLDALIMQCKKFNVKIMRSTPVKAVKVKNSHIDRVITDNDEFTADKYILTTGGKSYPKTGSTGDGYIFAQQAGHTVTDLYPAIVPVRTRETWVKLASGCNLRNVRLNVILDGKKIDERFGEMEFTNFGISGPIVMDLSSHVPDWQGELIFSLDLKPTLTQEILIERIKREIKNFYGHKRFFGLVRSLVPAQMVKLILELSDIPHDKPIEYISDEEILELVNLLKDIRMNINGLWSFNNAVVTRGGVSLKEVEPSTMKSKLCDNLYFAGEILDLNGPSGGFNLQICWSTGYTAGS
ncbi:MAG: NAD(P)/FAD-dependent oxidoreductase [Synergistales bacterium]|nr:NAD(P)/FAD-dependent oxidoreductase [Synergistales bacterium]MDY6401606.1 NAD(P)/FAD-dependent oxidoreductase [Synergistales bacterium]MDY6404302.1 NAD(P)/FAD-dependent oxidoreductase [Synergistales bacterium]MDY6410684.1 NAD(P)/FAD-dependent oxidoreductase [Synergistales bacterium]MDY6414003.1 NAD(P)/FAD-dependent oxidoreductase [Synergistales bacterium]